MPTVSAQNQNNPLNSHDHIALTEAYSAHNYSPLQVVLARGEGAWVFDVEGKRYLDMLTAYSAVTFGHCNPRLVTAAERQLKRLTLSSRAFYNDQLGVFCKNLAHYCGMETVLPMTSGAEAVETAIKCARKWAYDEKGVEESKAEIICFAGNFHGRTTTIISFSDSPASQKGFGPFTPGFVVLPYGDIDSVQRHITRSTAAILVEPIQGEGGIILPPAGFLRNLREICDRENLLLIDDEIQTGFCRTGKRFAMDHEGVIPDLYVLGKALGGGITPLSAVVGRAHVMKVFTPGTHGSTFGGNPLACAIGLEVLQLINDEKPEQRAASKGAYLLEELRKLNSPFIGGIRGLGMLIGVDIRREHGDAKKFCSKLLEAGVLCKDTRSQTIRFAPPVSISDDDIEWGLSKLRTVFRGT